jgi:hypothetical protein
VAVGSWMVAVGCRCAGCMVAGVGSLEHSIDGWADAGAGLRVDVDTGG